jgi:hypothetical protein
MKLSWTGSDWGPQRRLDFSLQTGGSQNSLPSSPHFSSSLRLFLQQDCYSLKIRVPLKFVEILLLEDMKVEPLGGD